jgi:hypothetical protein
MTQSSRHFPYGVGLSNATELSGYRAMHFALDALIVVIVAAAAFLVGWDRAMARLSPEFAKFLRRYDP